MARTTFDGPVRSLNGFLGTGPNMARSISGATYDGGTDIAGIDFYQGKIIQVGNAVTVFNLPSIIDTADGASAGPGSDPANLNRVGIKYHFIITSNLTGGNTFVLNAGTAAGRNTADVFKGMAIYNNTATDPGAVTAFNTAADLNETSLEQSLIDIAGFVDERGLKIASQGVKMIIPKELQFTAERLMKTPQRVGTADNDINAIVSMGMLPQGYRVNNFLSDTDSFFILTDIPNGLKMFVRSPIKTAMEGDFDTGNVRFKARERYSFGFSDPRCIFGNGNLPTS
jgi:hypothetical protein